MNLTTKQIKEIESIADKSPSVKVLFEEYKMFFEDPTRIMHSKLTRLVSTLSKDIDLLTSTGSGILTEDGGDKRFERVMALFKEAPKIYESLRIGKKDIDPNWREEKSDSEEDSAVM